MKTIAKGLAVLTICGALNFGLTADALAADVELINPSDAEYQYVYRPPRRYRDDYRMPTPPRYDRHRDRIASPPPSPPPPGWGASPPPMPPPPRR